ncbi:MAG: hypothetical protein KF780_02010 [Sphingomonas sp.]|nr:hypothetical protein [Sphingomonas sp.]
MMARFLHPVPCRAATRRDAWRRHLLVGCATASTLALAAHGDKASAQAFQLNDANPSVQAGSVDFSRNTTPTPGAETITVNSSTAIINWNRAETDFLPTGSVATFQNGSGVTNFAVLNRIFSLDGGPVRFDGTVLSRIDGNPGGTVIFQNTGGIIVGSTAVFDVGNLVLTTLNVFDETGYGDFINSGGGLDMGSFTSAGVVTEPGAQIRATAEGSYVVLAGSFVDHGGSTYVNGTAAYIGAQDVSYTINDGLFDIVVNLGSFNETPIIHTGTTGGPASTGAGDPHRIFMVTAPLDSFAVANMLVSGSVGFDEAVSASIENGQIVLSAGFNIENGQLGSEAKYAESNIYITGGSFTSDVFARATRNVIATSEDGPLSFTGDYTAEAFERAQLGAVNGTVTVGGNVSLTAYGALEFESGYGVGAGVGQGEFAPLGVDVTGGIAEITAENGESVTIAGNASLDASAVGEFENDDDFEAGDGFGGIVRVVTTGNGAIAIGGDLTMTATGEGAVTDYVPDLGGNGFGGDAIVSAQTGSITVDGGLFVDVSGTGSRSNGLETGQGAGGSGGTVSINAFSGSVSFAGAGQIVARGTGGAIEEPDGSAVAGAGFGGDLFISAFSGNVALGSSMAVDLSGQGGAGPTGGEGVGGFMSAGAGAGQIDLGAISVDLGGFGGNSEDGTVGGTGTGGSIDLIAFSSPGSILTADSVAITAFGEGGDGAVGGEGQGGSIYIVAQEGGGAIEFGDVAASANGLGGTGTNAGGAGFGGDIRAGTQESGYGSSAPASATFGDTVFAASGAGGAGGVSGGDGTGGFIEISARGGQVGFGDLFAGVSGVGGTGGTGTGGAGTGGAATVYVSIGGELSFDDAVILSDGLGGNGATGGAGTGGIQVNSPVVAPSGGSFLSSFGGTVTGNSATLKSRGTGGAGASGPGGNGQGGSVAISAFNGPEDSLIELASASLDNSAVGGAGGTSASGTGAAGGNAAAGDLIVAEANSLNGTLRVASLTMTSTAVGGAGGAGTTGVGGRGGDAFGGFVQAGGTSGNGSGDTNGVVEFGTVTADASAVGGAGGANGGAGGDGQGGSATLLSRGGTLTATSVDFVANGTGGSSDTGAGGNGSGGRVAALLTTRFQTTIGSTNTIGAFSGVAGGTGGAGATFGQSRYGTGFIDVLGSTATFGSASLTTFGPGAPSIPELAAPVYIRAQDGTLTFTGSLDVDSVAAVNIEPEAGTIALQGSADIVSQTGISIAATDSGRLSGGAWNLDTPGAVVITHSNRPGSAPTVDVASLTVFGSDFTASSGTLTRASQTIGVNVANLATIAGTVVSPDIFIASRDIDIPGTGFLGDSTTTGITLSVAPQSAQTVIGGSATGPGYTLTQAELGRIRTASLQIDASPTGSAPSRPADLVVRDLTLSATPTQTGAAVNRLQISVTAGEGAGGIVQVEGALRIENGSATSGIDIVAGERVQIINPAGSIRVLNSAGLPTGSLGIQSANIWSASQSIIDRLIEDPNFEGRNDALLANDGEVQERGYIEAGDILFRVGSTLFVQNSGTADQFAGITVTQNTLTVQPSSSGPIDVYAFGRRINADGTFVINTPYFREVAFGASSGYLADAQFNTCFIATGSCGGDPEQPVPGGPEIIEGPIDEVEESVPPPNPDRQQFVDVSFASESLLEEPVTSGGDSGVWDSEDEVCTPEEPCEPAGDGGY